jgi:hypothetical protein
MKMNASNSGESEWCTIYEGLSNRGRRSLFKKCCPEYRGTKRDKVGGGKKGVSRKKINENQDRRVHESDCANGRQGIIPTRIGPGEISLVGFNARETELRQR